MEEFFQELNEQQRQAVYEESPRICVIAGPGCVLGLQEKIGARTIEKIEKNSEEEGMSIYSYLNNFATIANLSQDKLATGQVEKISEWLVIAFEDKKLIKTRNNLILSSVHQAKGLEFEIVFFVYLDHGTLPYRETQDITEEKSGRGANQAANLGERQNQQTQSAVLQLASNLLDNTNKLSQLTRRTDGTARTIQEIEEDFLISAFQPDLNRPVLEHAREKCRRDVENWLRWQSKEYNRHLEKYQKRFQELKRIEDLIREYQKIREQELLDKIEIPDLTAEKRIGATNILYTNGKEPNRIGGSCDLIIFLKPNNNQEAKINFIIDLGEYEDYYKQIIRNFLTEKGKKNDVYVLVRNLTSARGDSAGIAFYLTLHSLVNRIPLPRNLGSTGTVYGTKTGAIGGLNRKLEYNVKKENPINIFILSEENKNNEPRLNQNGQHVTHNQIETALSEILKEPDRHIIHSCSIKIPPKPEEPNPNSSITSEQLLSLMAEFILWGPAQNQKDFHKKILILFLKNESFNNVLQRVLELNKKTLQKISETEKNTSPIDKAKELDELNKLETKIIDFFSKLEKVHNKEDSLMKSDEQVVEGIISAAKNFGFPGHEYSDEKKTVGDNFDLARKKVKEQSEKKGSEEEKKLIRQGYEDSFKIIASTISTTEILNELEKIGYTITEIEWTGKLHAPSLTGESSVSQEKQYKEKLLAEMQQVIENSPLVIQLKEENNTLKTFIEGYKLGKEFVKPAQKGQEFEDYVQEKLREIFSGSDTIENITHARTSSGTRADVLQLIQEESEQEKVVGKIIYEAKNTEKWENS
nr:14958_t:CDS:2 [Entrophospora candida]